MIVLLLFIVLLLIFISDCLAASLQIGLHYQIGFGVARWSEFLFMCSLVRDAACVPSGRVWSGSYDAG